MQESDTAAQETARVPAKDDDIDVRTIRGEDLDAKIDTSIFDVFTDFELDLSCLSTPPSPEASTSELPPPTPSPPSSPVLARTSSYASQLSSLTKRLPAKKALSHKLSSTVSAAPRGSWPLVKYAGRGTPIDRSRRLEWAGFSTEEVGEDGLLSSHVRSTSLDSGIRPSQRSLSPEWNYLPRLSSSSSHSEGTTPRDHSVDEQPPELAPIEIEAKEDEWDSIMKTVLSPTVESTEPDEEEDRGEEKSESKSDSERATENTDPTNIPSDTPTMSPEQIEQLNTVTGFDIDLGLNAALDLGLGQRGGMNWFNLGLLPTSASGRESPSVYSYQAQTPQASPRASVQPSEHRSTTSTKAEGNAVTNVKSEPSRWWRKMVNQIRRVQTLVTIHKNRF
ncbi:hypothetical protein CPB84DRAFT_1723068 [Gymnopilus junonius]|uniref:Uncharacterized protein n=1 Tax=Gymnopilus junonius TaxID=109634 RepID=A0A9P5P0P3_GYMJU|nr:hypothetical protein CPB84DRAFT_1723068 [Gymnopilus junonius]